MKFIARERERDKRERKEGRERQRKRVDRGRQMSILQMWSP